MNCDLFATLCLRTNGQFSWRCSAGHDISMGSGSAAADWKVEHVLGARGYSVARAMFRRGQAPWGETCRQCIIFQPDVPFAHERRIKRLGTRPDGDPTGSTR